MGREPGGGSPRSSAKNQQSGDFVKREMKRAVDAAIAELDDRGEIGPSLLPSLRSASYLDLFSFSAEQILGGWFPPAPKAQE